MPVKPNINIQAICSIAVQAGKKLLEFYRKNDLQVQYKEDNSPVSAADYAANKIITGEIEKLAYSFPILSEEGADIPYEVRKDWETFWLIDPLDGTKEFIKGNDNFTVNIGLVYQSFPIAGVIYLPVNDVLYFADKNGAFKQIASGELIRLQLPQEPDYQNLRAVKSSSNAYRPEEYEVLKKLNVKQITPIGSAVKYCMIAEGSADIYYRQSPNMEWDSAAGQAIIEISGGKVLDANKQRFAYNKPSLINGEFICYGFGDSSKLI
ncbi:3'(2'),5'-bisphosphate nucleotidase [Thermoflexibacter ruber]|uniref:3'(2'),5'-bisphosphate nucleotidase CysQ n=1 Tax=Thermoflexibacter ruber TaxID=1003 RepID=A0A1I2IR81_9BACT|nr:3'(2'),5'-bisphosphate nucleotidase [Thermoflexibacter ruber]